MIRQRHLVVSQPYPISASYLSIFVVDVSVIKLAFLFLERLEVATLHFGFDFFLQSLNCTDMVSLCLI